MFGNTGTAAGIALRLSSAQDDAAIAPTRPLESRSRLVPVEGAPGSATATLPMFVEYVRTGATFKPGSIRGQAILVMDYQ